MAKGKMGGGSIDIAKKMESLRGQLKGQNASVNPSIKSPKMAAPSPGSNVGGKMPLSAKMPDKGVPAAAKASNPMSGLGGGKKLGNHYSNK